KRSSIPANGAWSGASGRMVWTTRAVVMHNPAGPAKTPSGRFLKSNNMSSTLKSLRALSDPTRLRIVALLEKDELSVNELQEITRMGQSRISTHLGLLQDSELVQSRRE